MVSTEKKATTTAMQQDPYLSEMNWYMDSAATKHFYKGMKKFAGTVRWRNKQDIPSTKRPGGRLISFIRCRYKPETVQLYF